MEAKEGKTNIENVFGLFSSAAMNPRPYAAKLPLPATITVPLGPQEMEMLQIIAARIGAPRTNVAHHILKLGVYEAFHGCGFTIDEDGNIPKEQLKWDVAPRSTGLSFGETKEAA